ncbi:hypothetical protein [Dongia sp.]|uniref:hypothetical protein n=1 Tax=Dongia sp. TaxID=1977262 RepID=UPI0035B364E3
MADDIADLRARVEAARERLSDDVAVARKVELRLNDLVSIVEGSLARQGAELDSAKGRIVELEADLERALARAEQALGEASRAERLAKENGELKQMVMTLLEVIEGRQKSSLGAVMQKLEENVSALVEAPAAEAAAASAMPSEEAATKDIAVAVAAFEDTEAEAETEIAPAVGADINIVAEAMVEEDFGSGEADTEEPMPIPDKEPAAEIEDLSEIALYDAADEVVEPNKT